MTLRVCGLRTGVYDPGRAEPGIKKGKEEQKDLGFAGEKAYCKGVEKGDKKETKKKGKFFGGVLRRFETAVPTGQKARARMGFAVVVLLGVLL